MTVWDELESALTIKLYCHDELIFCYLLFHCGLYNYVYYHFLFCNNKQNVAICTVDLWSLSTTGLFLVTEVQHHLHLPDS